MDLRWNELGKLCLEHAVCFLLSCCLFYEVTLFPVSYGKKGCRSSGLDVTGCATGRHWGGVYRAQSLKTGNVVFGRGWRDFRSLSVYVMISSSWAYWACYYCRLWIQLIFYYSSQCVFWLHWVFHCYCSCFLKRAGYKCTVVFFFPKRTA